MSGASASYAKQGHKEKTKTNIGQLATTAAKKNMGKVMKNLKEKDTN